jgi:hypothetical protein
MMFLTQSAAVHHLHGFFRKVAGRYPKPAHTLRREKAA